MGDLEGALGLETDLKRLAEGAARAPAGVLDLPELNRKLNDLHLRAELFLTDHPFGPDGDGAVWAVGYTRIHGEGWRLAARRVCVPPETPEWDHRFSRPALDGPPLPLTALPRPMQLAAAALLPELLERLRQQVFTTVRVIQWARLMPDVVRRLHYRTAPKE